MDNESFVKIANIVLGTMFGLLFALPLSLSWQHPAFAVFFVLFCTAMGGFCGYRRSNSRVFLYFSLVAIGVLSTVITISMSN